MSPFRLTVLRDQSDVPVDSMKSLTNDVRAKMYYAVQNKARMHALLDFGIPICERVPALQETERIAIDSNVAFQEGIPLGISHGTNISVYTHFKFVIWYRMGKRGYDPVVKVVGAEVVAKVCFLCSSCVFVFFFVFLKNRLVACSVE
jgi:hypothetical protein